MKTILAGITLAALPLTAPAVSASGALRELAADAVVVVGARAPAPEVEAARLIAGALSASGGTAAGPVTDSAALADLELAAAHHLIVVGTELSNQLLESIPSHWIYDAAAHRPPSAPPALTLTLNTKGFRCAGYGNFLRGDAGYVEWARNPYWHYAQNLVNDSKQPEVDNLKIPYRQIVRVTGNSPQGVLLAARAALDGLLTGVTFSAGAALAPGELWTLPLEQLSPPAVSAPEFMPRETLTDGTLSLSLAGWHMADAMLYSGFSDAAGRPAKQIWRAKYLTEQKLALPLVSDAVPEISSVRSPVFDASMARRASGNEIFVALLASPDEAAAAAQALEATLTALSPKLHTPWSDLSASGVKWRVSRGGLHLAASGSYVIMESFDQQHDKLFLAAMGQKLTGGANK